MKLTPYAETLVMGKEALDKTLAPKRANAIQKQGELERARLEEEIARLENDIQILQSGKDLNFPTLLDKLDDLALKERRYQQFTEILKQLFPESK